MDFGEIKMEKQLLQLAEQRDLQGLVERAQKVELTQVFKLLREEFCKGRPTGVVVVRALFQGFASSDDGSCKKRFETYKFVLNILQKTELQQHLASELVGLLLLETDFLHVSCLTELADSFVDSIKNGENLNGRWFELVPKVLATIASREVICFEGNEMSGAQYKSDIVHSLCSNKWNPKIAVHLASMFRDTPLSQQELKLVLDKLLKFLPDLDLQETPSLTYQLLLLAAKGPRKIILNELVRFFNQLDEKFSMQQNQDTEIPDFALMEAPHNVELARQTEGTIILHVTFAAKQDQELGKEFVKMLKARQHNPKSILSPFNLALSLSLSKMKRFEAQILDVLKNAILRSFQEKQKKCDSNWMRNMLPVDFDVTTSVLETVSNSQFGWDYVIQGLIRLGFTLLDSFGPKRSFGRDNNLPSHSIPQTPNEEACFLGARIIQETFKAHEIVRAEVLEQILNRVVAKNTSPVDHYVAVLAKTVHAAPQLFLDSISRLREVLDYLPFLPHCSAESLLNAFIPLLKVSIYLKDSMMLLLRKAMFNRQLEARKIAVVGFLMILRNFKVFGGFTQSQSQRSTQQSISLSQIRVDVHKECNTGSNEAVCLELLGTLKRALTQQADVKNLLYQGLYDVLCKNPQISEAILELLMTQFHRYYEFAEDISPPLKLNSCIQTQMDEVQLVEPLAQLVFSVQQCLTTSLNRGPVEEIDSDDEELEMKNKLQRLMKTLVSRMITTELEDFELDKLTGYNPSSLHDTKNIILAGELLGIYEGLIEYSFTAKEVSVQSCSDVLALFKRYHKIEETLTEKMPGAGRKKDNNQSCKGMKYNSVVGRNRTRLLSLRVVAEILKFLFCDCSPDHKDSLSLLRQEENFVIFIVKVAVQRINQFKDKGKCDGCEGKHDSRLVEHFCTIGRSLLKHVSKDVLSNTQHKKPTADLLRTLCLDGLSTLFEVFSSSHVNYYQAFLMSFEKEGKVEIGSLEEDLLKTHLNNFQHIIDDTLKCSEDDHPRKESISLLSIVSCLSKHVQPASLIFKESFHWIHKLCSEQEINDSGVAKAMLSLCLTLGHQSKGYISLLRDVANQIHSILGDITEDLEVENKKQLAVINEKTALPLTHLLLFHADLILNEIDWILDQMKAQITVDSEPNKDAEPLENRIQKEYSLCSHLGQLITVFHELIQTAFPLRSCANTTLKLVSRIYNTLGAFTKYYICVYNLKIGHLCSKFEKLVKLSSTHLTPLVDTFITYEAYERANCQGPLKKKPKMDSKAQKVNVVRETKSIPPVIYSKEYYEQFLVQLTNKSKVNLMGHVKLSTSRDFRINKEKVKEVFEQASTSEDENVIITP
ncbi:Fanconi anemia complementation group I isoform X3 [Tachypleus tridentatus]|uniref:Fanconi anemia complementation group I isoform X3 n=3 Tax=Tachypleus tridentatus TaxID=6853 RepID=UPI003FD3431F